MVVLRYLAHGTATDYIYDVVNVPLAFTVEVSLVFGSSAHLSSRVNNGDNILFTG